MLLFDGHVLRKSVVVVVVLLVSSPGVSASFVSRCRVRDVLCVLVCVVFVFPL